MKWLRTVLLVLALLHVLFGLYGLYAPLQMAQIVDLGASTPGAIGEIRAIYGGLFLALGLVIARGWFGGPLAAAWLRVVAMGYTGLFVGRVVSVAIDGPSGYTLFAGAFEIAIAGFFAWAATELRGAGRSETPSGGSATSGSAGDVVGDGQ
jgi:hypothetical protein